MSRVRRLFAESGLDAALHRRPPIGPRYRRLDDEQEARLLALACGPARDGRARWTLRVLADKLIKLRVVKSIDPATVHRTLTKTRLSRG